MRPCGSCTLCCKVMGVVALDKPEGQRCPRCAWRRGCLDYASRPEECRTFNCQWRLGHVPAAKRPDRIHAVVHKTTDLQHLVILEDPDHPCDGRVALRDEIGFVTRALGRRVVVVLGPHRVVYPLGAW